MDSREVWHERLASAGEALGFQEGFKFLYGPWAGIGQSDTIFLSLNPGLPPAGAELCTVSDERGNSYEVERDITASPITAQFLALAEMLSLRPVEILTGVVAPFRSNRWKDTPLAGRKAALALGEDFWSQVFEARRPRRVIACCPEAAKLAAALLGARHELTMPSGWGSIALRRSRADDGAIVAQIPHLSTFKLMSRAECIPPLRELLELS